MSEIVYDTDGKYIVVIDEEPTAEVVVVEAPVTEVQVVAFMGPKGDPGTPGASVGSASYKWSNSTTAGDPGTGKIRANGGDMTAITELYASVYNQDGQLVRLDQIATGGTLTIYEASAIGTWNRYTITGDVIVSAPLGPDEEPTWFLVPVAYDATGPDPFTPSNNQNVVLQTPVQPNLSPITDAIEALQVDVEALRTDVDSQQQAIINLQGDLADDEELIQDLQEAVVQLAANGDNLFVRMNDMDTRVDGLEARIAALETAVFGGG